MSQAAVLQTPTMKATTNHSHALLVQRKCSCGGSSGLAGSCSDCENKKLLGQPIQTKLRVNEPHDESEQEADQAAERVMRTADPAKDATVAAAPLVNQRLNGAGGGSVSAPAIVHDVLSSPGQPLDAASRAFFEPRFRHDFSRVRVHTDAQAQQVAESIHARAFTIGRDIAMGTGEYSPEARASRRLLAHELAHVVQQEGPGANPTTAAAGLMIQRTEGPDASETVPDDAPVPGKWIISEQPHAGVIRDPAKGFKPATNRQPIPPATIVSPLDYREESGVTYVWVEWSGGIDWVLQSDVLEFDSTYATRRGDDAYRQNVKSFPADAELTPDQKALVERAMKFTDETIETPKEMDELGLDAVLLTRLKTFYRFLSQEDLITDQKFPMAGSRKPWKAHELSTKWMLNKRNGFLGDPAKRIEFARLLVEIGGKDEVTDIVWANDEQVKKLSIALKEIRYEEVGVELARFLIPPDWKFGWARDPEWNDPRIKDILKKHQAGDDFKQWFDHQWEMWPAHTDWFTRTMEKGLALDKQDVHLIVADIRNYFSQDAQQPQAAPALEGYPKGARERYPNIMDVEMTHHLTGDAADIHFPYKFYYYDPVIDAIAKVFGLGRVALKGAHGEYWHYQAVGQPLGGEQSSQERKAQ